MGLSNLFQDGSRLLTFTIANSHFGVDVNHILAFSDECNQIQRVETDNPGFLGYLDYRDVLVNVYDSATVLKRRRNLDQHNQWVNDIERYKQAHIDWVEHLEHALKIAAPFTLSNHPLMHSLIKWQATFSTTHPDLKTLLDKLIPPHQTLRTLPDTLNTLRAEDDLHRAERILSIAKGTTLKKLLRLLDNLQELLASHIHPVLLHLTQDGTTPWYSIVLDEVDDIIDYSVSDLDTSAVSALTQEPIKGYLRQKNGNSYMMLCVNQLFEQVTQITPEAPCNS